MLLEPILFEPVFSISCNLLRVSVQAEAKYFLQNIILILLYPYSRVVSEIPDLCYIVDGDNPIKPRKNCNLSFAEVVFVGVINPPLDDKSEAEETQRDIKDLASGALVSFVGKLGRISRGAFIWVITFFLGWDVQGLYTLSWGLVSTLNKVGRLGLQRGVVRYIVKARMAADQEGIARAQGAAMVVGLLCSLMVAGLVMLSADWIAGFYNRPIGSAMRIMALSAPFLTLVWIFVASTQALRIMRYDVYVTSIASPLFLLVGGLVVGFADLGLEGIAWVQVGMAIACCVLAGHYFRNFFSLSKCLNCVGQGLPWKPLGRFSFPVMLTDLLYSLLTQIDVLMLGFFVREEEVGLYAIARRLASAMLKAPQAFDPMFSSIVSELSSRQRHQELGYRFVVISRWILTINLPIFAALLMVGDHLLALDAGDDIFGLTGAEVEAGISVLFLLCIGMMLQGLFAVAEPLLVMAGRPYLNMSNNAIWLVVNFLLNLLLISSYGIVGAALGATLSMALANGIRLLQVYRIHRVQPFRRSQLKPVAAVLVASLISWLVQDQMPLPLLWSVVGSLVAFLGLYIFLLYLLGMEAEDRALLARLRRRLGLFGAQHCRNG